jgi:DNA repair photolyase
MEQKLLLKLVDGGIVDIQDNSYFSSGCPTCDYGSCYINDCIFELTSIVIDIQISKMYDYVLSQGDLIKIVLSNMSDLLQMTEKEFSIWLEKELNEIMNRKKVYVTGNIQYVVKPK